MPIFAMEVFESTRCNCEKNSRKQASDTLKEAFRYYLGGFESLPLTLLYLTEAK